MTERKLSDAEAVALWREAERRLKLVDAEPPVSMARVDALLGVLGARKEGESLTDWLTRSGKAPVEETRPSAEIIQFSPRRQRFMPVAEITRLAADTSGPDLPLPARELETADGRFRLKVSIEGDQVLIAVQALGLAADEFAGRTLGIAGADAEPVAVLQLDEDGDGSVRLPDSPELRRALLKPVLGVIEDL
jgi:hypothetical protein